MNFAKQLKELQTKVDDTFLPCAIYCAKSGNLQDSLLRDFNPEKHTSHFTSSEKGWTNDKLGFKWLEVFDKHKDQTAEMWCVHIYIY
jgi:hypothetical protein